jgi:hypothetical protein
MGEHAMELAERAITAWRAGDLEAVESMLHPTFSGARLSRAKGIATAEMT